MMGMNFGEGAIALVFVLATWMVPLLLAIWFIRTISAMASAQRDMVEQLRTIAQLVRDRSMTTTP